MEEDELPNPRSVVITVIQYRNKSKSPKFQTMISMDSGYLLTFENSSISLSLHMSHILDLYFHE
jgi:hypothetical protein